MAAGVLGVSKHEAVRRWCPVEFRPLFSSRKYLDLATIIFLFIFDNYYLVIDLLGLKNLSCKL